MKVTLVGDSGTGDAWLVPGGDDEEGAWAAAMRLVDDGGASADDENLGQSEDASLRGDTGGDVGEGSFTSCRYCWCLLSGAVRGSVLAPEKESHSSASPPRARSSGPLPLRGPRLATLLLVCVDHELVAEQPLALTRELPVETPGN